VCLTAAAAAAAAAARVDGCLESELEDVLLPHEVTCVLHCCSAAGAAAAAGARVDGCLESELEDVLLPHEVAAVAAVGPSGAPSFVLQVSAAWFCGFVESPGGAECFR
jgi:hypothetical protein